jgi:hypothetical protein
MPRLKKPQKRTRLLLIGAAKAKLAKIEVLKLRLKRTRDSIRNAVNEIDEICESIDVGVEDIGAGIDLIRDGIDNCSKSI